MENASNKEEHPSFTILGGNREREKRERETGMIYRNERGRVKGEGGSAQRPCLAYSSLFFSKGLVWFAWLTSTSAWNEY